MRVQVLGCSGGIGGSDCRTTALLLDEDILIDCGTGVGDLPLDALARIDQVFLTHSHLDHLALLPMLIDAVADQRKHPLTVYAAEETLHALRAHVFNWQIWPDFTALPDQNDPILRLQPVQPGETIVLGARRIRPLHALHSVPALGYCVDEGGEKLVFTGDTAICDELIEELNGLPGLRYLLIETAFPNRHHDLADAARHMSPDSLETMLARLHSNPEVFVTHIKPGYSDLVVREVSCGKGRLHPSVLLKGQRFCL